MHFPGGGEADGRGIHDHRSGARPVPRNLGNDLSDRGDGRETEKDDCRGLGDLSHGLDRCRARGRPLARSGHVVRDHAVTGCRHVLRHGSAHVPEPDESDRFLAHCLLPNLPVTE